jgi:hypothetical protein
LLKASLSILAQECRKAYLDAEPETPEDMPRLLSFYRKHDFTPDEPYCENIDLGILIEDFGKQTKVTMVKKF